MSVNPSWQLLAALILMVALSVVASRIAHFKMGPAMAWAAVRATVQLLVVSAIIVAAIAHLWSSALFVLAMFAIAVWTTTGRVGTRNAWGWSALAMAAGVAPLLVIVFATGTAPVNGYSLVPIGSIFVGNMMTSHTLNGRRVFPALRDNIATYEAVLSIGLPRSNAIGMVLEPIAGEAIVPALDSTRTVGLVTLPGAFIGVLLGGGSALQAGAAQLLVLVGIVAGQAVTVAVMNAFIRQARLLPRDLKARLRP